MTTIYRSTKCRINEEGDYNFWLGKAQKFYSAVNLSEIEHHRVRGVKAGDLPDRWFERYTKVYGLEVV